MAGAANGAWGGGVGSDVLEAGLQLAVQDNVIFKVRHPMAAGDVSADCQ
jgi:hypothetical protein